MRKTIIVSLLLISFSAFSQEVSEIKIAKKQNIFLDISAGFGSRLGKNAGRNSIERQHAENLKSGFSYDISLYLRLVDNKNSFIGFKYNAFKKNAVINDAYVVAPNGQEGYGEFSDNVTISFYGISYLYSKELANTGAFNVDVSLGYINYNDKAVYLRDYKIKGGALGVYTSGSYYFRLLDNFSIGPKIGLLIGTLNSAKVEGPNGYQENIKFDKDTKESLTRIDLAIGTRIKF